MPSLRDEIDSMMIVPEKGDPNYERKAGHYDMLRAVLEIIDRHEAAKPITSEMLVLSYAQRLTQTPHTGDQGQDAETYKVILRDMLTHRSATPNTETQAAMKEARRGGLQSFETVEHLMRDLNDDERPARDNVVKVATTVKAEEHIAAIFDCAHAIVESIDAQTRVNQELARAILALAGKSK